MKQILFLLFFLMVISTFAQTVVDIDLSSCDRDSDPDYIYRNRLINKEVIGDTLYLHLGIVRNCALSPNVDLSRQGDSLVIQIVNSSDIWSACICCYEMKIKALDVSDTNFVLLLKQNVKNDESSNLKKYFEIKRYSNKFIFPTISEIMDSVSENKFYKDSLKVGLWSFYHEDTGLLKSKYSYFINSNGQTQTEWYALFDENKELLEICRISIKGTKDMDYSFCLTGEQYNRYILNKD